MTMIPPNAKPNSEMPQPDPMLEEGPVSPMRKAMIIGVAVCMAGLLFFGMTREAPQQVANMPAADAPATAAPQSPKAQRETTGHATPAEPRPQSAPNSPNQ